MTHKPFDLEKAMRNGGRCMTRGGNQMKIIYTELPCNYPIAAYCDETPEQVHTYRLDGRIMEKETGDDDLINIPQKRTGWIAHRIPSYKNSKMMRVTTPIYQTKEELLLSLDGLENEYEIQEISWDEV